MTIAKVFLPAILWSCAACAASLTPARASAAPLPAALETLQFFGGANGSAPAANLTLGADGNLYGTTSGYDGSVFKVTPGGALTTVYAFSHAQSANGLSPEASVVQGSDGNLYGTTSAGGSNGAGTIFQLTPAGVLTTLYAFPATACALVDAAVPGLIEGSDGNFYGVAASGGANCDGSIYKITPAGAYTTLYTFAGADGATPAANLIEGSDGNFYGTTYGGGANGDGTVFRLTPAGALTTLYSFSGSDGLQPAANLVQGLDGDLYGTTSAGGNGYGTIFKITPAGALTTLYRFTGGVGPGGDGGLPNSLIQATDGNFYGTTEGGGPGGYQAVGYTDGSGAPTSNGTVFELSPDGTLTTLYAFGRADGAAPQAGLIQAANGNFYGTTADAGAQGGGTLFELSVGLAPGPAVAPAPGALAAAPGDSQVTLSWAAVPGATGYNVYAASAARYTAYGDGFPAQAAATVTGTSATLTGLSGGTAYDFAVAWVDANGTSGLSSVVSATPTGAAAVPPPPIFGGGYDHGGGAMGAPWLALLGLAFCARALKARLHPGRALRIRLP